MARQTNRNDLCPCGSGKTFKQCCDHPAKMALEPPAKGHEHSLGRGIDWLMTKHRKAMMDALEAELFGALSDEDAKALQALDPETLQGIEINIMEWLLAEGKFWSVANPNGSRHVCSVPAALYSRRMSALLSFNSQPSLCNCMW